MPKPLKHFLLCSRVRHLFILFHYAESIEHLLLCSGVRHLVILFHYAETIETFLAVFRSKAPLSSEHVLCSPSLYGSSLNNSLGDCLEYHRTPSTPNVLMMGPFVVPSTCVPFPFLWLLLAQSTSLEKVYLVELHSKSIISIGKWSVLIPI